MSKDEILEGNKLIAQFLGFTQKTSSNRYKIPSEPGYGKLSDIIFIDNCEYNSSWDWLMPVIEKIESLRHKTTRESYYQVKISSNNCLICNIHGTVIAQETGDSKINGTYEAVILFIKYWNKK